MSSVETNETVGVVADCDPMSESIEDYVLRIAPYLLRGELKLERPIWSGRAAAQAAEEIYRTAQRLRAKRLEGVENNQGSESDG